MDIDREKNLEWARRNGIHPNWLLDNYREMLRGLTRFSHGDRLYQLRRTLGEFNKKGTAK